MEQSDRLMPTPETFRRALGRFATGIAVVTTRLPLEAGSEGTEGEGAGRGITVNAVSSVSLDPPLVLFCLGRAAYHFQAFAAAGAFAINILDGDQQALSDRFARETDDDLAGLEIKTLATGSPILASCAVALDCTREAAHAAGDHLILVGRVAGIHHRGEAPAADPLIYYASAYRRLAP